MKYPPQKLCSILLALIMLVGIVPAGILTVEAGSVPLRSTYWDFTDMTEETLRQDWTIGNEASDQWELTANGLVLKNNTGEINNGTNTNVFLTSVSGDYIAETKLQLSESWSSPRQAGLTFYGDTAKIKLALQGGSINFSMQDNGSWATLADGTTSVWLRVKKSGNEYAAYYSLDGLEYTIVGTRVMEASDPKLGLFSSWYEADNKAVTATFSYVSVTNNQGGPHSWNFTKTSSEQFAAEWEILREDHEQWELTSDGLVLKNVTGEINNDSNMNVFLTSGRGDYVVETKLLLSESWNSPRQAGLTFFGDTLKIKLALQGSGVNLSMMDNGTWAMLPDGTTSVWLRMKKSGNEYTAYYSLDGLEYTIVGMRTMEASNPKMGLFSSWYDADSKAVTVTFPFLNILDVSSATSKTLILNQQTLRLKVGDTFQLNATPSAAGSELGEVAWMSKDEAVVMVSQTGLLTAQAEGYAIVQAHSSTAGSGTMVVSVLPAETIYSSHQGNPYLPLWECIPDGEPHVFEDPDNPGTYRVYIYGSHDNRGDSEWCGLDQVVWSAPVEDLSVWRYDGVIFETNIDGDTGAMFAPDIAEVINDDDSKTYYFYPNSTGRRTANNVAVSNRPDGPFKVPSGTAGILGSDPAVFVDDDDRVYGYWGDTNYGQWGELDPETMCTLKPGESAHANLPSASQCEAENFDASAFNIVNDENAQRFRFFEGSSLRKVGNKYVFIWARTGASDELMGTRQSLAYAYSDSPAGPWKYGGIIVSSGGESVNGGHTFMSTNIHGSICEINDQWYIFYHRGLQGINPRQAMVEAVTVNWDEAPVTNGGQVRISTVESTAKGFALNGLDPYRQHSAGIVSYLTGNFNFSINYDRSSTTLPILNIKNGVIAGVKYFDFDKDVEENHQTTLCLNLCPKGVDGAVDVFLRPTTAANTPPVKTDGIITSVGEGSIKLGTVELTADMPQTMTAFTIDASKVDELSGQWGLFFSFRSASGDAICDFSTMEFAAEPIHVTSVSIDETLTLEVNESKALTAHIYPEAAADKTVSWSSSDPEIAAVDSNGNVTGIKKGNATITVTTTDDSLTDTCVVTVNDTLVDRAYALIDAIGEVTKDSGEEIEAARAAFDALTDAQKSRVSNAAALSHAERTYDAALAAEVGRLINAIGTVMLDSEERIQTARAAYDRLTDVQKDLVTNLGALQAAEAALKKLKDAKDDKPNTTPVVAKPSVRDFGKDTASAASLPFTDVAKTAWYYSAVNSAWENRLIDGISKDRFLPEGELTRAQAIKLAATLHQLEHTGSVSLTNGNANWYDSYLSYAVENGIIEKDYAAYTTAQLNAPVSRSEFVHIFHGAQSAYTVINSIADNAIPDVDTNDLFATEIYAFYRAGILTGSDTKGTFHPARSISRAEVAAILIRMYDSDARLSFSLV